MTVTYGLRGVFTNHLEVYDDDDDDDDSTPSHLVNSFQVR